MDSDHAIPTRGVRQDWEGKIQQTWAAVAREAAEVTVARAAWAVAAWAARVAWAAGVAVAVRVATGRRLMRRGR